MSNVVTRTASEQYDLISINGVPAPDVKKGGVSVQRNVKYVEYEGMLGNKVIDIIDESKIKGAVSYNGLMQPELQTIAAAVSLVSVFEIYNPLTDQKKTFTALILEDPSEKIIHDENANAWSYGFTFEEIDDAPED